MQIDTKISALDKLSEWASGLGDWIIEPDELRAKIQELKEYDQIFNLLTYEAGIDEGRIRAMEENKC